MKVHGNSSHCILLQILWWVLSCRKRVASTFPSILAKNTSVASVSLLLTLRQFCALQRALSIPAAEIVHRMPMPTFSALFWSRCCPWDRKSLQPHVYLWIVQSTWWQIQAWLYWDSNQQEQWVHKWVTTHLVDWCYKWPSSSIVYFSLGYAFYEVLLFHGPHSLLQIVDLLIEQYQQRSFVSSKVLLVLELVLSYWLAICYVINTLINYIWAK